MMNSEVRGSIRWRGETRHALLVAPVVTAELVITVGLEQSSHGRMGFLDAWERDTGRLRWSFSGSAEMGLKGGILGQPEVAGNLVCLASGRGRLLGLDVRSGLTRWEAQAGGPVVAAPVIGVEQVFFVSEDGSLIALELETGQPRWTFRTGGAIRAAPVILAGHVIVGSWDGHLYGLTTDGVLLWQADLSPARPTALAAGPGWVVLFDTAGGDVRSAAIKQVGAAWRVEEGWRLPIGRRSGVTPVLGLDRVYLVGRGDDLVTCAQVASGVPQWTAATGNAPLTPVVEGEQLIVASRDGRIVALDLRTGREQWRVETGVSLTSEPAVHEGVLYAGGRDRAVYAFVLE